MRGVVVGGTASGVGKTVATLATIRALTNAGLDVQPAKAGPDFIDPSHHEAVAGQPSRTLDVWLSGRSGIRRNYWRGQGDICVIEGVMGLYDGSVSSTAAVAEALSLPVVLVVDASASMESVGATALGFREYAKRAGRDIDVVGVIAQRAHGGRHERGIRESLPERVAYLGRIPPEDDLEVPDRHLGLHMAQEAPIDPTVLDVAAETVDATGLVDVAREPPRPTTCERLEPTDRCVAVALDDAFRFVYPATMERLRERARVEVFSPIAGDRLPDADGVYLPGGYPELHVDALNSSPALDDLRDRAPDGLPIFGECGGLMALAESLSTADGETYEMAGVLPARVRMQDRYQALDHVELRPREETTIAGTDDRLCGHEFHYSRAQVDADARFAFDVERGRGIDGDHDGLTEHHALGTYAHLHADSGAFDAFVEAL